MAKMISEKQRKLRILEKVISLGYKSEEDIKKLAPKDLTKDETINFEDILLFCKMQDSVKNNRLYSFLAQDTGVV